MLEKLFEAIEQHLGTDANLDGVKEAIKNYQIPSDSIKDYVTANSSIHDSLISKAVASYKDKRDTLDAERSAKLKEEALAEAKELIAKEGQKSDVELKLEAMQKELAEKDRKAANLELEGRLMDIAKADGLTVHNPKRFSIYGERAEEEMREVAKANKELIDAAIETAKASQYGQGKPPGGGEPPSTQGDDLGLFGEDAFQTA